MTQTKRLIINTVAQYIKTIFNVLLGLYATRIVMLNLGVSDFGIFNLIAGVIAFLAFISSALANATQRFLSYYFDQNLPLKVKTVFTNSLFIHGIFGLLMLIVVEIIGLFLWDGFLVIPINRIQTAQLVYHITGFVLFLSFITTPYRALCITHENFIGISLLDMLNAVLKLFAALILYWISYDHLAVYAWGILGATLIYGFSFLTLCHLKYSEVKQLKWQFISIKECKVLTHFMGWSIYSQACIVGRTQGLAILLNRALGTIINASYGLALQVNGSIRFLSQSLVNAMSPQIIKAEGVNNRKRVIELSHKASKFAFLLLAIIVVPTWFEMPYLLTLWLHEVPEGAILFCRMMLLATLVDQLSLPLTIVNSATGRIRNFVLLIDTVKLFTLLIAAYLLHVGYSYIHVMWAFVAIETFCSLERIVYMYYDIQLSLVCYFRKVIVPCMYGILCLILPAIGVYLFVEEGFMRLIVMYLLTFFTLFVNLYFLLDVHEKIQLKEFVARKFKRNL
ncbi:hypothetical protein N9251_00380 [Gammaproteobacteria bacterium]|nr:hypothetical protein [Gammaproteobacteria bacterium]